MIKITYTIIDELSELLNLSIERKEILSLLTSALADIYQSVKWKTIARSKSSLDIFQHRLLTASSMPTVIRAFEKLAHGLSIQATTISAETFLKLETQEEQILKLLREETRLLVSLTYSEVKRRRKIKKEENNK